MRWTLSILVVVAVIAGVISLSHQAYEHRTIARAIAATKYIRNGVTFHTSPVPSQARYPLSVIPGGFQSLEEFKAKVDLDPILQAEFAGCFDEPAVVYQLDAPAVVYMTFRRGDKISYTSHRVHVAAGEWVASLPSCHKLVLLRCGNSFSWDPAVPTDDVNVAQLESPEPPPFPPVAAFPSGTDGTFSPITPLWIPPTTERSSQLPPIGSTLFPIGGGCCAVSVPVVVTPEPSVLKMILAVVLGFCAGKLGKALFVSWKESA